jgi:hypothetical protein
MKKTVITLAIMLTFGGSVWAQSTEVVSANVLGYIKVLNPASNKYSLVAAPLNCGTGTVSTLIDIFGTNQLRQSSVVGRGDFIILWNPVIQQYVRYGQKTNGLFYLSTAFTGSPTNPAVTRGQAMWILSPPAAYSPTNKTVLIMGNVPNDGAYTNYIVGNSGKPLSFIANPYPVEMDLNSLINTNDGAIANAVVGRGDQVRIWNDATQQYVYCGLKASTNMAVNNKWLISTAFTATNPPIVKIKPGQGFWYQTTNALSWIESKSYTLQ